MTLHNPAYERNRDPILSVLKQVLGPKDGRVLEVGSGAGHHAVYFAEHFPHINWTTSEVPSLHGVLKSNLVEAGGTNLSGPIDFEVGVHEPALKEYDVIFSANVLHIMAEEKVRVLISHLGREVKPGAKVLFYGPFNYGGNYTSESNAAFDVWLKSVDPTRGLRAFEDISRWMAELGFTLQQDFEMPSNNRILYFTCVPAKEC